MIYDLSKLDTTKLQLFITEHHKLYDFPVKDIAAENIFVRFLDLNGYKPLWDQGSHKQGSDVFVDGKGSSLKSAKEPLRGEYLKISSYRTETHVTIEDKKNAIREIEKKIENYVIFARRESKVKKQPKILINYSVYVINPEVLSIDSFRIDGPDDKGNYSGVNGLGVKLFIAKTMSSQLWHSVPMKLVRDGNEIKTLCSVGPFEMKLWNE